MESISKEFICLTSPGHTTVEKLAKYFDFADELLTLFDNVQDGLQKKQINNESLGEYQAILLASGPKTINSVLSLCQLCNSGLTEDARSILRKILEVTTTLMYLNLDIQKKEERAKMFYHFGTIQNKKHLFYIEKYPQYFSDFLVREFSARKESFESAYQSKKSIYPCNQEGDILSDFKRNWNGMSLIQTIIECKMAKELVPYSVFSDSTHFSSTDIISYIDFKNTAVLTGHNLEEVPNLLISCVQLAGQVIQFIDLEFNLGLDGELYELAERVRKAEEKLNEEQAKS